VARGSIHDAMTLRDATPIVLTLNAGSSSLRFALFEGTPDGSVDGPALARGAVDGIGHRARIVVMRQDGSRDDSAAVSPHATHAEALVALLDWLDREGIDPMVVGHRVVHGGEALADPVMIENATIEQLRALIPLAPLHQPHNLAPIEALRTLRPGLPQVACFDTAFHRTQSPLARDFALPRSLTTDGIHRYGFHGLSYEAIAGKMPEHMGQDAEGRVIVAHLGNGASLCAMRARTSVATTMGFTTLDGLMMGTRCGAIDPGVLLYLMQQRGWSVDQVATLLYQRSGLLGVSGISSDMRVLLASDDPHAATAIDLFVHRVAREIGSLAAALEGLDALVFTGGIGENAPRVRARIGAAARWLGVDIDERANTAGSACISVDGSRVSAWVIATDEERVIARHATQVLAAGAAAPGR